MIDIITNTNTQDVDSLGESWTAILTMGLLLEHKGIGIAGKGDSFRESVDTLLGNLENSKGPSGISDLDWKSFKSGITMAAAVVLGRANIELKGRFLPNITLDEEYGIEHFISDLNNVSDFLHKYSPTFRKYKYEIVNSSAIQIVSLKKQLLTAAIKATSQEQEIAMRNIGVASKAMLGLNMDRRTFIFGLAAYLATIGNISALPFIPKTDDLLAKLNNINLRSDALSAIVASGDQKAIEPLFGYLVSTSRAKWQFRLDVAKAIIELGARNYEFKPEQGLLLRLALRQPIGRGEYIDLFDMDAPRDYFEQGFDFRVVIEPETSHFERLELKENVWPYNYVNVEKKGKPEKFGVEKGRSLAAPWVDQTYLTDVGHFFGFSSGASAGQVDMTNAISLIDELMAKITGDQENNNAIGNQIVQLLGNNPSMDMLKQIRSKILKYLEHGTREQQKIALLLIPAFRPVNKDTLDVLERLMNGNVATTDPQFAVGEFNKFLNNLFKNRFSDQAMLGQMQSIEMMNSAWETALVLYNLMLKAPKLKNIELLGQKSLEWIQSNSEKKKIIGFYLLKALIKAGLLSPSEDLFDEILQIQKRSASFPVQLAGAEFLRTIRPDFQIRDSIGKFTQFRDAVVQALRPSQLEYQNSAKLNMLVSEIMSEKSPEEALSDEIAKVDEIDLAQIASENGGIDLNQIKVNSVGRAIDVQFDQAQFNEFLRGGFDGFSPVIVTITPIQSPLPLLGVNTATAPSVQQGTP